MSNIDLSLNPTGTPPTDSQEIQIRDSLGVDRALGVADPTINSGVEAAVGTLGYTNETPARYFKKWGTGATQWTKIATQTSLDSIATVVTGLLPSGDNSAIIQAVIDEVATKGGGEVIIPAGIWEIASTIDISTSNIRLRGEGGDWNQDVGVQGTQAATTLKWIGTEFDGVAVVSTSLDTVSHNGTRLNDATSFATPDIAKYQGMVIQDVSGVTDLIMDSDDGYVEVKADSNWGWIDSQTYNVYKPSVMVEVHSVYGDGATDQQIVGSGVQRIHFDCQDAHIGLRVIAANNGEYRDLSFIEPKTAAIYMGVKNIGTMQKPATVSQDPQFNDFENIMSRNFAGGEYGGLFVCNGVVDWGSNTSFNSFRDMRAWFKDGDAIVLGSSDANLFENCLSIRGAGSGDGLKLLGTNRDVGTGDVPRGNRFTQFGTTGGGQILCYGTGDGVSDNPDLDLYQYGPSHDNAFIWLNTDNGTPLPKTGYDANVFYDTDKGHSYEQKAIQMVVAASKVGADNARDDVGAESLRIENNDNAHVVYSTSLGDKWRHYVNPDGDFITSKLVGSGIFRFTSRFASMGTRRNIREMVNVDANVQDNDDTILLSATTKNAKAILTPTPENGDVYTIKCLDATFTPTIGRNGNLIEGVDANYVMVLNESVTLQFYEGNWNVISREHDIDFTTAAPSTSTSTGTQGQTIQDGNYLYVCIATNTWKRSQLLDW